MTVELVYRCTLGEYYYFVTTVLDILAELRTLRLCVCDDHHDCMTWTEDACEINVIKSYLSTSLGARERATVIMIISHISVHSREGFKSLYITARAPVIFRFSHRLFRTRRSGGPRAARGRT